MSRLILFCGVFQKILLAKLGLDPSAAGYASKTEREREPPVSQRMEPVIDGVVSEAQSARRGDAIVWTQSLNLAPARTSYSRAAKHVLGQLTIRRRRGLDRTNDRRRGLVVRNIPAVSISLRFGRSRSIGAFSPVVTSRIDFTRGV